MPPDLPTAAGQLLLALALGVLIGVEREVRGSAAGMRTFGLVALGACLYVIVGTVAATGANGRTGDQGRIAAQVVTGVGFLGGGMLIRTGASVHGLTTAAGIWVAAAVGLAVGTGLYAIALVATALALVVLRVLYLVEKTWFMK